MAHYAVDPDAPANARIADLGLAPRDGDGKVRFSGDVVLLRPDGGGNRRALLAVPNRGMVRLPFCGAQARSGFRPRGGGPVALGGGPGPGPRGDGFAGLDAPAQREADRWGSGVALAQAYQGLGLTDETFLGYEGGRHELFHETNRDEVLADLVAWLETRFPVVTDRA